jgi:hypothetical protein
MKYLRQLTHKKKMFIEVTVLNVQNPRSGSPVGFASGKGSN